VSYLFGAFFALWAITFGYVISLSARESKLRQELEALIERTSDRRTVS
jgi:CcmD family protein